MIKRVVVKKLFGKYDFDLEFNPDLNILTGRNGCGKTTLLKLIWAVVSANIKELFEEIVFDYIKVEDNQGYNQYSLDSEKKEISLNLKNNELPTEINLNNIALENMNKYRFTTGFTSLFFPTFRRIEGGFQTDKNTTLKKGLNAIALKLNIIEAETNIQHHFITSISTTDITNVLNSKYAEIANKLNDLDEEKSKQILELANTVVNQEKKALDDIKKVVEESEVKKQEILRPWTVLTQTLERLFADKSVNLTEKLKIGNIGKVIDSNRLSSGEKQMLSFLAYNFAFDNTVFFIDEPEISLHADWQRQLFSLLQEQNTTNQFIVTTHSPMIYSRYPDKEIIIDPNKGGKSE